MGLGLGALSSRCGAQVGHPPVEYFGAKLTGRGEVQVWSTIQDTDGRLYFGSDVILTFDGDRWQRFQVPGAYEINDLALGYDDKLWIASAGDIGFCRRTPQGLQAYQSLLPWLPKEEREVGNVWQVFAKRDGAVFVGTRKVMVWDGKRMRIYPFNPPRRLFGMKVDGKVLVSCSSSGVWEIGDGEPANVISSTLLGGSSVFWADRDGAGWLLATAAGLYRKEGAQIREVGQDARAWLKSKIIVFGFRLPNGNICLSTLGSGLGVFTSDGQLIRVFDNKKDGFLDSVFSACVARDGSLWLTGAEGIARVAMDQGTALCDSHEGLPSSQISALATVGSRVLAATLDDCFMAKLEPGEKPRFSRAPSMGNFLTALQPFGDTAVFAAGFKRIVLLKDDEARTVFKGSDEFVALSLSSYNPESLIVACDSRVLRLGPPAVGQEPWEAQVVANLSFLTRSVVDDADGNIWLGSASKGIFLVPHGRSEAERVPLSAPIGGVAQTGPSFVQRFAGGIVGFSPEGIHLLRAHRAPRPVGASVPASRPIAVSNPAPDSAIWAAFDSPFPDGARVPILGRLSQDREGNMEWTMFQVPGLGNVGLIQALFADPQGYLWIGGDESLLRADTRRLAVETSPAAPLIQANIPSGAQLRNDRNLVKIDLSSLQYGRRAAFRFETRLSGAAGEWSTPTDNPHIELAGLREGAYTFSARLVNEAGFASEAATLVFSILPPWYSTLWARTGFVLTAAAAVFGALQWRLAFLRRQNARLEALVAKKTEQLQKANEAKSEFLANMSHEIRNPISGILGLSLAFEETDMSDRQKSLASSINSCASLLATLVDDVLDFSKIESGTVELRSGKFRLRQLMQQCVDMVDEVARASGVSITVAVAGELPDEFVGDAARVQQIVLNFLTNAIKFGRGQPVVLGADPGLHDRVRIFVRDQGPGMTEAEAASLFTKFTRLDAARAANIHGTGLGLAVCKLLAGKMGGRTGVESAPGKGSLFWAEIPFMPADAAATRAAAPAERASPIKALIVEDIDYNIVAMQAMLRRLGIESDVATDGLSALERLGAYHYDVAFLDWNLPGLLGTEVAARHRAAESATRRTVLIATTAHSADFNREACMKAGMDAFISKPITPAKIAAALSGVGGALRAAAPIEVEQKAKAPEGIDMEMLRYLGSETLEGLAVQIDRYLASFEADRMNIRSAVSLCDRPEIRRLAHRLLSHCSMVKYERLSRVAAELQDVAATAAPDRLNDLLATFEKEYEQFRYKLEPFRSATAPA